jgi:tetratricopeptide (TPR) repeat protein
MAASPSDDYARQRYAQFLAARGRVDQALDEVQEARRLDPNSETTELVFISILHYARRFPEAESMLLSLVGRAPNPRPVHIQLGRIFAATGRFDKAIEEFQATPDPASGDTYLAAEIASAHAAAGRVAQAQEILDRLTERARTEEISPDLFALICARLGRFDAAFQYLNQAVSEKTRRIVWLKVDPRWDPLRSDARFSTVLGRLGL